MFIRIIVANNIKSTIPKTKSCKEFMNFVEERSQSQSASKSLAETLMGTLTITKFDGSHSMHQHLTEIIDIATKLKSMGMKVSKSIFVQFIINSLPPEHDPFQINFNSIKDKWNANELQKYPHLGGSKA